VLVRPVPLQQVPATTSDQRTKVGQQTMTEHWPKSVEEVTRHFYCDTCKEGTPHRETSPNIWRCTRPHEKPARARAHANQIKLDLLTAEQLHIEALDGMGNRDPTDRGPQLTKELHECEENQVRSNKHHNPPQ
jgi:hypothetical protein